MTQRPTPPFTAGERATLDGWLDWHRETLATKVAGLTDAQGATPSVDPSAFTLTGLVQHLAEVERNWTGRILLGEDTPHLFAPSPSGDSGGFDVTAETSLADAVALWRTEVERSRTRCAPLALDDTGKLGGQPVSLRWILLHLLEEYARHNGHADLVRERIDGVTGV